MNLLLYLCFRSREPLKCFSSSTSTGGGGGDGSYLEGFLLKCRSSSLESYSTECDFLPPPLVNVTATAAFIDDDDDDL